MKKKFFQLTISIVFLISSVIIFKLAAGSKEEPQKLTSNIENNNLKASLKKKNEEVLVKTFLLTNWLEIDRIFEMKYDQLKATLQLNLQQRTSIKKEDFKKIADHDLATFVLMYRFLKESEIKTIEELKMLTISDLEDEVLKANKVNTNYLATDLKKFSNYKNLQIAYDWWLPKNYAQLIQNINNVEAVNVYYKLKDNFNRTTEVLKIEKVDEHDFKYLGVYHKMIANNHFQLSLAGSNDLKNWEFIVNLGDRAHQGELKKWGEGFLLVNEEDKIEGANNIQVSYFNSYTNLKQNIAEERVSLPRKFSKYAEGTPDIRKIIGKDPSNSYLQIGFHYFNNGDVDYQAMGVLKNFKHWKAWKDNISNHNVIEKGFKGNIGGRSSFKISNTELVILEAQIRKNDFGKWRLLLGDGAFYTSLNLQTAKNSTSFANPGIAKISDSTFAITSFLHSKGNHSSENGQLLYISTIIK